MLGRSTVRLSGCRCVIEITTFGCLSLNRVNIFGTCSGKAATIRRTLPLLSGHGSECDQMSLVDDRVAFGRDIESRVRWVTRRVRALFSSEEFCVEGCGVVKSRTPRMLAAIALGCSMALSPATALAEPTQGGETAQVQALVRAQAPEPAPPIPEDGESANEPTSSQRYGIGVTGAVLIGLVLLSRKLRKKPIIGVPWKKDG